MSAPGQDPERIPTSQTRYTFLREEFTRAFGPELCGLEGDVLLPNEMGILEREEVHVDEADYTDADSGVIRLSGYVGGGGGREFIVTFKIIDVSVDPPHDTYARD